MVTSAPLRLGITGSAGSGKSSLVDRLAARLGLNPVPEAMRAMLEAGFDFHTLTREGHRALLRHQAGDLADRLAADAGLVTDRTPLDFAAFWLVNGFAVDDPEGAEALVLAAAEATACYDAVVLLPWAGTGLVADGIRSANPWMQLHFQTVIEGLCRRFVAPERLLTIPDDVPLDRRTDWVVERIRPV